MRDDDDPVVEAWLVGPQHAISRIPRDLQIRVLKRLLAKLEKATTPRRAKRGRPKTESKPT